jgi:hypothetical protein
VPDDDEELGGGVGPFGRALDAGRIHDDAGAVAAEAARHLGIGTRPQDDHAQGVPLLGHRDAEALRDRQHRGEDDHDAGDADHRRGRCAEALADRTERHAGDGEGLCEPVHGASC